MKTVIVKEVVYPVGGKNRPFVVNIVGVWNNGERLFQQESSGCRGASSVRRDMEEFIAKGAEKVSAEVYEEMFHTIYTWTYRIVLEG